MDGKVDELAGVAECGEEVVRDAALVRSGCVGGITVRAAPAPAVFRLDGGLSRCGIRMASREGSDGTKYTCSTPSAAIAALPSAVGCSD